MDSTTSPAGGPTVPPVPAPDPRTGGGDGFFDSVRRVGLVRTQDRWIGGVAGGLARRFGVDPALVRGIFAVTVLLGGAGLVVYGLAWALLPEEADGRIHLQETVRGRFDAALLGAVAVVIVGLNRGDGWYGWWDHRGFGWVTGLLWLAALGAVIAMLVAASRQRRARRAGGPGPATWSAMASPPPPPPGGSRTVPHPGYGPVPYAPGPPAPSGVPSAPAGTGWSAGSATSPVPPPPAAYGAPGGPPAPPDGPPVTPGGRPGPTASRPAGAFVPPTGPPPAPRRPRVEGPGRAAVGAVVGLTLLAFAALLVLDRQGELVAPVLLTGLGIGVVLAGLGIIVSGLRGRSSGTLGLLAVVGLVAAVPAAALPAQADRFGFVGGDRFTVSTDQTWAPTTATEARGGISVGFGDLEVDLTQVPLGAAPIEVPIRMSAGDLRVVVPDDAAVTGDISVAAGEVTWAVDGEQRVAGFSGGRVEDFASEEAADGDVQLALRITAGAGEVRVEGESS